MSTDMKPIKGYTVLTDTISGPDLVWRTGEGIHAMPLVFDTERQAQLEIVDDILTDIEDFKDDGREYNEIHRFSEYIVAEIEINEEGEITVWESEGTGNEIISTTLKKWREGL